MSTRFYGLLLWLLALLCRLPFLSEGYGKEFDAWSNALNARVISETGVYEVSRLPGHPIQELLLSFLWPLSHSYFFYNFLTAIISAFAVWAFYEILKIHRVSKALIWAAAFNFIPVFFIAGTSTIDYNFALAFILLAYRSMLKGSYLWAGFFIGIATGFRISSLGFLAPFALLLGIRNWRVWMPLSLTAAVVAALAFSPAFIQYGFSFLDFHKPPFPGWASVLYKLAIGIWGLPFLLFILASIFKWRFDENRLELPPQFQGISLTWFLVLVIALQLYVFIRLPFKAEFFIPAIPFVIIWLASRLPENWARWAAYASLSSLLSFGFDYDNPWRGAPAGDTVFRFLAGGQTIYCNPVKGPLLIDRDKRRVRSQTVEQSIKVLEKSQPALVVAGWYWPELVFKYPNNPHFIDHYSSEAEIDSAHTAGLRILYLPEIGEQNSIMSGHSRLMEVGEPLLQP